jgi:hypothetical protein
MNKKTFFILGSVLLFSMASTVCFGAAEWDRSIHAEWEYTPPEDVNVVSFRLYQNGTRVCDFAGATTVSGDCDVTLTRKTTNYTLTAVTDDGGESPHSDIYPFVDWGPKAKIKSIINR